MKNAWYVLQEKLMGTKKNLIILKSSRDRFLQEWTPRFSIPSVANNAESLASARLGWWFSVLCQVSDPATPKREGIHTKIMKWIKTIICILLLGLGMFCLIFSVFETFKRIWHIRKSDSLGLWFLFKIFKRSWLIVNLRFEFKLFKDSLGLPW